MKLRVRSLESKETHRIEVPNSCNLQQLKEAINRVISPSSSSTAMDENMLLSLNRKDELCGSSSDESLQSIGVASGDLIYYSCNPFAFSSQNPNLVTAPSNPNDQNRDIGNNRKHESSNLVESMVGNDLSRELVDAQVEGSSKLSDPNGQTQNLVHLKEEENVEISESSEKSEGTEDMEVDVDDDSVLEANGKFSVPSFLKKVFVKEVGDAANGDDHKLLVVAVHAVLLESGFVAYDPVSGMRVDGFNLRDEWPKSAFGLSLRYTLPELASSEAVETVVLKFQTLGKFFNIYGSVPDKGFGVHRVCLDESRFVDALSFILKNRDHPESGKLHPNRETFEFWKLVKDGLSYPLLIDLCEKTGLVPPPCFMRLPTELKLKILEALPAVDIARVSCVSSELQFIASNNELWKMKYEEEFGIAADLQREYQWKAKFSSAWDTRKRRKRMCTLREPPHFRPLFPGRRNPTFPALRDPSFPGSPFIIGGDYDLSPSSGFPRNHGPRIFRWNCNLGGFGP